jgi:hypothetical protein
MGPEFLALFLAARAATPPTDKPQLICRKSEQETGSHIRTPRQCKSAEEWAKEDEEKTRASASTKITEGQGDSLTPH